LRPFIFLLVVCLCAPLFAHAAQPVYEGPGWDTPEEAVLYYLEGLKEQDIGKMIGAYPVETTIDHFDLRAQLTRFRVYTMDMSPNLPNTSDLLRAINVDARRHEIVQSISHHMALLCLSGQDFFQPPVSFAQETIDEEVDVFVTALEDAFAAVDFGTLEVLLFVPPEVISETYASERHQENMQMRIAPTGADEMRSVVAFFIVDGRACVLACDAIRYGDRWFMANPYGSIASLIGLPAYTQGLVVLSKEELVALWDELGFAVQIPFSIDLYDLLKLLGE